MYAGKIIQPVKVKKKEKRKKKIKNGKEGEKENIIGKKGKRWGQKGNREKEGIVLKKNRKKNQSQILGRGKENH